MPWSQVYDPFNSMVVSILLAALPIVVLLGGIGIFHMKAHRTALRELIVALLVAIVGFAMPAGMAGTTAVYGAAYGLLPIGWIILSVIFIYRLTEKTEQFSTLHDSMASASSSGGVMGKMIDAESIVVASTAANWYGYENSILRYVFFHSIALACLVGLLVMAQAYVPPFTHMVP